MTTATTSTKHRSVVLRDEEVTRVLAGRKTQIRIPARPQPFWNVDGWYLRKGHEYISRFKRIYDGEHEGPKIPCSAEETIMACLKSPFGKPGDRIYVRETWSPDHADFYPHFPIVYREETHIEMSVIPGHVYSPEQQKFCPFRWRPAATMPRSVARVYLLVKEVRVERADAIDQAGAVAEGFESIDDFRAHWDMRYPRLGSDRWKLFVWVGTVELIQKNAWS